MAEFCAAHKIKTVVVFYVLIRKNLKDISLKAKRNRSRVRTLCSLRSLLCTLVIYRYDMSF